MGFIEDRLRPGDVASPWRRDVLAVACLLLLAVALVPGWVSELGPISGANSEAEAADLFANRAYYLSKVPGQVASFHLLLALGFALALRCGAVDLSVWAVAGAGGVVAAKLMNSGMSAPASFAVVVAAGAAVGAINALAVSGARMPSAAVTLAAAIALTVGVRAWVGTEAVAIAPERFAAFRDLLPDPPLLLGRMLIVAAAWSAVMIVLMVADSARAATARIGRRAELLAAMAVSGALSALGGACWLIDHSAAPAIHSSVGDLRVPAAVLLAGGALLAGRGRTMIVGLLLLPAVLLATIWRQEVLLLTVGGLAVQSVILICMIVVVQVAIVTATRQWGALAAAALVLTVGGVALLAASARVQGPTGRTAFHLAALAIWLAGAALLLARRYFHARRPSPS